jgi:probable rRNA maturation factor
MTAKSASPRNTARKKAQSQARKSPKRAGAKPQQVQVSNRQSHVRIATTYIRTLVRAVLAAEQISAATISIALADNATVRRVNRDYLGHDYDTDVLSFLFESTPAPARKTKHKGAQRLSRGCQIDGEILASAEMAAQMAPDFGWSARDELALYLIHGLLHLCGYDDQTPRDRRIMRSREQTILNELGVSSAGRGSHPAAGKPHRRKIGSAGASPSRGDPRRLRANGSPP